MLLNVPSDKPMPFVPAKNLKKAVETTMTAMAPSSTRLMADATSAASDGTGAVSVATTPKPHPEEPLLYLIPNELHPTYRPLPMLARIAVVLLSVWTSAISTWKHLTFLQPFAVLRGSRAAPSVGEWLRFIAKSIIFGLLAQATLQDIFLPPSRVSMNELQQRFHLPSAVSNFKKLHVPSRNGTHVPIGVHFLKYTNSNGKKTSVFDAVHCHHGFGASSLSWLPVLPSLVKRLGAHVGLAHDMVGFGFTDRKKELEWYTTDASARISREVMLQEASANRPLESVALFGHSLGGVGVLKMALQLPRETAKLIVLCSPALGFSGNFADESTLSLPLSSALGRTKAKITGILRRLFVFPIGGYVLRRLVGLRDSWKLGLKGAAFADPEMVKDSDVLRYQWPSIGKGWERGLLQFARAQTKLDDKELLRQVLALPNTTVAVIIGSKDTVVPPDGTRRFLSQFQEYNIEVVEMEGLGHVCYEEDVEGFMEALEAILEKKMRR